MIKKVPRLVITFYTTTEAMAMEQVCRANHADGRMIPVPGNISADCGLAWSADPDSEDALLALMTENQLRCQGIYHCLV